MTSSLAESHVSEDDILLIFIGLTGNCTSVSPKLQYSHHRKTPLRRYSIYCPIKSYSNLFIDQSISHILGLMIRYVVGHIEGWIKNLIAIIGYDDWRDVANRHEMQESKLLMEGIIFFIILLHQGVNCIRLDGSVWNIYFYCNFFLVFCIIVRIFMKMCFLYFSISRKCFMVS